MISKKVFAGNGSITRFLSDFIIRSEQFTRVYNYMFDVNGIEGDIDPTSGLYIRVNDVPNSADLVTIDKWDLVDNSISFYVAPYGGSRIYIEVATTPEEFGDTLVQPSVERAEAAAAASEASAAAALASESSALASKNAAAISAAAALTSANDAASHASASATSATNSANSAAASLASAQAAQAAQAAALASAQAAAASESAAAASASASATSATDSQLKAWIAEAEALTAQSYAVQAEDVFVNVYTSDGDGTFTATATTVYSTLHYTLKFAAVDFPTPAFPADEGLALVARATGNDWEKILGLPLETGNLGKSVTTDGVEGDSFWSYVNTNPNTMTSDQTMTVGTSASVVDGFTIADGVTLTIPDGSVLSIV